jgi:diguanylate cyclase (GGDEF)-like protein
MLIIRIAAILVTAAVIVMLGTALHVSQAASQRQLALRFEARGQLAASFASTRVAQLLDQEDSVAVDLVSGTKHLDESLAVAADVFDFRAAVILDSQGRTMAAYPRAQGLIGSDLASGYPHLQAALKGHRTASSVIVSSTRHVPVVELAVPYYTPNGRRVFSGAYELNATPLDAVLKSVTPLPGSRVYLVDSAGKAVASTAKQAGTQQQGEMPDVLATALRHAAQGDYDSGTGRPYFYTGHRVAGTPWSLVLTAPQETLFAPVGGPGRTVPWLVLCMVALLAGAANWMLLRLLRGRDTLRALNATLDKSARTDQLTNLPNRRHLDEALAAALSAGGRHQLPVSVLVMDLDHFKQVNDTYGHTTGDRVLEHVARVLEQAVRTEDIVGRWGGEEFLAVLPHTDGPGANQIAERLRQLVQDSPYTNKAGDRIVATTLSIGCATDAGSGDDNLIHRADQALYRAKADGRNSVRSEHPLATSTGPLVVPAMEVTPRSKNPARPSQT